MRPLPVVAVLGPTASGKSSLAEALAERFQGELVNGDAYAVYSELSVGVTKPDRQSLAKHRYHLLNVTTLEQGMTLVDYQHQAERAVREVAGRDRLPIVVGGSSLYTRALLDGYLPPAIEVSRSLRERVRALSLEQALERLQHLDPAAFARIDRRNPRRVHRALELAEAVGGEVPAPQARVPEGFRVLRLILEPDREILLERIEARTRTMWPGWVEEVDHLQRKGLARWLQLRKPIGYGEVLAHLRGDMSRQEATDLIVKATAALAKKQRTWLRREKGREDTHVWQLKQSEDWDALATGAGEIVKAFLARIGTAEEETRWH